jgi:hypothetical protein
MSRTDEVGQAYGIPAQSWGRAAEALDYAYEKGIDDYDGSATPPQLFDNPRMQKAFAEGWTLAASEEVRS